MAITPLPTAPAVTDTTADFNNKAFAWVDALGTFVTEANALAAEVNQDAIDVAAAALDAATIETVWSDMQPVFLGGKASDPTLDNEGNALVEGAIYFNTTTDTLRAYTGTDWADAGTAIPITLTHDTFNGDGSTVDFTLSVTPGSQNAVRVSLSGVIQVPGTDYTLTNAILTFTTAPPTGTGNISCLSTTPIQVGTPNDASVSTAKLQDNSVTNEKIADNAVDLDQLAHGTQGDVLYFGASGAPARLGAGVNSAPLCSAGAGANPTFGPALTTGTDYVLAVVADTVSVVMSTAQTSYTKVAEVQIVGNGHVDASFYLKSNNAGTTAYGRLYLNGSPVGTEHSVVGTTFAKKTDANLAVSHGDLLQIYMKSSSGSYQAQSVLLRIMSGTPGLSMPFDLFMDGTLGMPK